MNVCPNCGVPVIAIGVCASCSKALDQLPDQRDKLRPRKVQVKSVPNRRYEYIQLLRGKREKHGE